MAETLIALQLVATSAKGSFKLFSVGLEHQRDHPDFIVPNRAIICR